MRRFILLTWVLIGSAAAVGTVRAEGEDQPTVQKAVIYLKQQVTTAQQVGEMALAGLALVKAKVPPSDPSVQTCLNSVMGQFNGSSFKPQRGGPGGPGIYETGVIILFLANLDPVSHKQQIEAAAHYLISGQLSSGCWDYPQRTAGDASISQYAVLGLWEAENAGCPVPPQVWDKAAKWYLSAQDGQGAWCYHRDEGSPDTVSMTAAGVGSLLICERQLKPHMQARDTSKHAQLMTPVLADPAAASAYKPDTTPAMIDPAVARGITWVSAHFTPADTAIMGQSTLYGLYGIERIGALADKTTLGSVDWYNKGLQHITSTQGSDGSWAGNYGSVPNTAWGILFSTKSTAQTLKRIDFKRLGGGTLLGGRALPKNLNDLTIAGGRVLTRPMNGAIESMLNVLEDPRAQDADGALAGLLAHYQSDGPKVIRPYKDRFRKMITDRDPGIRTSAAWALGRIGDLDVVPDLITALMDSDESVVKEARWSLQLLSRKIDGYGPDPNAPLEARKEAARRWKEWYDGVQAISSPVADH